MNDDLISRQAAIDAMEESKLRYIDRRVIIGKMQDIINNLPSAQLEIIRCKDCNLFGQPQCLMTFDGYGWADPDGYCYVPQTVGKKEEENEQMERKN